ncbi:dehydrodolichyl diphosphate synthase complex subunit Dhdds [Sitodiplosis mosellana]|uniref:dehydrodolichyl diphosphate synthase complex subunit Dhdds n=1 Tax=Sitodiplosis mosellana TaxID=263140 RepID=UPI002443DB1F|nr:dehydrodolichyl diphosphate synthase complex subunit Dhdds [Sitodiplosis mosellana]XP_055320919.1 dehydrodolichyl diphosphate synthase complex subunit Dhdds [Sitodiplosis mosellana]
MSWMRDSSLNWAQKFALKVIKTGKIPRHVAFIMDGNRRYAKKLHLTTSTDGHVHGFDKLAEALQWCLDIGIEEVTVYAFSIENFKRDESEVNALLELAREKFNKFMEESDELNKRGICIRMIGNWKLLPVDLQKSMADAMLMTRNNNKAFLNVAFAYTSRDEITESIRDIVDGVKRNELESNDITDDLIRRCMYSGKSSDPDLLVRTSGESRLSDFLLWQASTSIIYFTKTLWPEFTFWHLLAGVFYYQRHYQSMHSVKRSLHQFSSVMDDESFTKDLEQVRQTSNIAEIETSSKLATFSQRATEFLEKFDKRKYNQLVELSTIKV